MKMGELKNARKVSPITLGWLVISLYKSRPFLKVSWEWNETDDFVKWLRRPLFYVQARVYIRKTV